jgi:hypothetical protein
VKRETGGAQQPWVSSSPIDGSFYFVSPEVAGGPKVATAPQPQIAGTLRPDPDFVPIRDTAVLRELSERLYERNFDPEVPDSNDGLRLAISKFQEKINLPPSGAATEGVLTRLRKMEDLKPWGSIAYGPASNKWGISWNHNSRKAAVDDARSNCRSGTYPIELSFYGNGCGPSRFQPNRGRWFSATPCKRPRTPRLTSATELANLAASSARFVPMGPAARLKSSVWKPSDHECHSSSIWHVPPLGFARSCTWSGSRACAIR